ncbi:MAG: hypothetical protein ACRDO1_04665, partial [Nocardioidaceae bacterium]
EPGGGQHATGRLLHMWADDKDGRRRRRYRVVDVETDQPLTVACALASDWAWKPRTEVTASPRNWTGTVTVHPPRPLADLLRDGSLRVAATLADGERRTVTLAQLEAAGAIASPNGSERSIIIVGGLDDAVDERGIIIVGGLGDEVSLNPQPLPPRELRARLGTRVIAEALRGAGWDGLRVRDDVLDRGGAIATTATPVVTDRFGELGLSKPLDTEIFVPDEENPAGWGTVTGIDFGVRKR